LKCDLDSVLCLLKTFLSILLQRVYALGRLLLFHRESEARICREKPVRPPNDLVATRASDPT